MRGGGNTKKFTAEDKRKARLGASGNLGLVTGTTGRLLNIGKKVVQGLGKKIVTNKMKKPKASICPAGIAWAKRTFDKYPSAYANMAASKYCKDPNYAKGSKKKKK